MRQPLWMSILLGLLPIFVLVGLFLLITRQMQGGARGAMGFGKSKAKLLTEHKGRKTFADVAGVDQCIPVSPVRIVPAVAPEAVRQE